jgi:cytoskeletal protein RodZ
MQTLGVYLKNGREAQNISLSDVADYTKISKIYLDCLENDEYTKIPAKPYVKGYISSYAACVGIDEHEALKLYHSIENEIDAEEIKSEILQNNRASLSQSLIHNQKIWLVLAFCILSMVAIGTFYSFFQNENEAASEISLEETNKTIQPRPKSTEKPEILPIRLDTNPLPSAKQTGIEEKIVSREIGKTQEDGISQLPAPLESQIPERDSKKVAQHPPINAVTQVSDLPGSAADKTIIDNNLSIIDAAVCTGIKDRIPQGIGNTFEWSTDRIYVWSRIKSESPPSSFRHIYYFKGKKVNDVSLKVNASHWRTWSYKTISNTRYIGPWRVDLATVDGNVLKSLKFEIK